MNTGHTRPSARVLLKWLLREEWEHHTRLINPYILAALPIFVLSISAAIGLILSPPTETAIGRIAIGVGTLAGAYRGAQLMYQAHRRNGFDNRGRLALSARTLPVSDTRIAALFIAETLLYYGVLIIAPLTVGLSYGLPVTPLQFFTAILGMFTVGLSSSIIGITVTARSRIAALSLTGVVVTFLALGVAGVPVVRFTPAVIYETGAIRDVVLGASSLAVTLVAATYLFSMTPSARLRRINPSFSYFSSLLPDTVPHCIALKILLQFHRSTGGIMKLLATGVLLSIIGADVTAMLPPTSRGIVIGLFIGLIGVPTYLWLDSYDTSKHYAILPIEPKVVRRARDEAYVILMSLTAVPVIATTLFLLRAPMVTAGTMILVATSTALLIAVFGRFFGNAPTRQ